MSTAPLETFTTSPKLSAIPNYAFSKGDVEIPTRSDYFLRAFKRIRKTVPWFWKPYPSIQRIEDEIYFATKHKLPILITGATGTGKELVARALHEVRKEKLDLSNGECPWVALNSATVPESLAESILFGHERGAFTSARDKQIGKYELAKQGTVFLDEIQSLSLQVQSKLLRVIQHTEIDRLGGSKPIKIECQTIVASNVALEKMVEQRLFRQDLYFRLNVSPIHIPELKDRMAEIPGLIEDLIQSINESHGTKIQKASSEVVELFMKHSWPGNLRELEHTLLFAALRGKDIIEKHHLNPNLFKKVS